MAKLTNDQIVAKIREKGRSGDSSVDWLYAELKKTLPVKAAIAKGFTLIGKALSEDIRQIEQRQIN